MAQSARKESHPITLGQRTRTIATRADGTAGERRWTRGVRERAGDPRRTPRARRMLVVARAFQPVLQPLAPMLCVGARRKGAPRPPPRRSPCHRVGISGTRRLALFCTIWAAGFVFSDDRRPSISRPQGWSLRRPAQAFAPKMLRIAASGAEFRGRRHGDCSSHPADGELNRIGGPAV